MADPGYCELYVDTRLSPDELTEFIRKETGGTIDHDYVDCDWGSFYVSTNDEHSIWKTNNENGFIYYKYIVEVNPWENKDFSDYVDGLRKLIQRLRMLPARTVAACDFEEELGQSRADNDKG